MEDDSWTYFKKDILITIQYLCYNANGNFEEVNIIWLYKIT